VDNGLWAVDKYIGFNAFRDLLGKGDAAGEQTAVTQNANGLSYDRYASNWRIGTEGLTEKKDNRSSKNGGSLILTDSEGKIGFSFIPAFRDGGSRYGFWEQQNVGTREIVDNIKIVFDDKGNIGIGNAPGLDQNAYPSQYQDPATGAIYYLPNANGAAVDPTAVSPESYLTLGLTPWVPSTGDTYGYGITVPGSAYTGSDVAGVNAKATAGEKIRFEISGEKANTRVGHTPERRGYGYPGWSSAATTGLPEVGATFSGAYIEIIDNGTADFALRYIGIQNNAGQIAKWQNATHGFTFDNLGRMMYYFVEFAGTNTFPDGTDLYQLYPSFRVPHPRDFGVDGPLGSNFPNTTDYPWTLGMTMTRLRKGTALSASAELWIPASAAAAELSTFSYDAGPSLAEATFAYDELQAAVMRLNNFNLGDGYQLVRSNGDVLDTTLISDITQIATKDIYDARTSSPKLLLTYAGLDTQTISSNGLTDPELASLVSSGLAPLMKVTTVIESAQNESALRTYTIPKADNTGGSFMVITDHMGEKEKDDPGLTALPKGSTGANRIILEKVVAHEVVRTGQVDNTYGYGFVEGDSDEGYYLAYYPGYELLPINYIKDHTIANSLNTERVLMDPQEQANGVSPRKFGSNIRRDLDTYWETDDDLYIGPFRTNDTGNTETFNKSEIRYRRLNEDYVMFDFNIDLRAKMWDTLRSCVPAQDVWNDHGLARRFTGDPGGMTNPNDELAAYVHSPYAPGHMLSSINFYNGQDPAVANKNVWVGIDARWVQYIRFSYDVQRDSFNTIEDPYFYERQFGGGPSFGNWNEYRAWYPGTATVGPYVGSGNFYTEYQFGQNPTSSGSTGNGAAGYNLTDGNPGGGAFPNTTNYQWNTLGTGSAYVTPRDGSPYSVWNSAVASNAGNLFNIVRYWNGRLNDWYMSRWSQHENISGSFPATNYDSQANTLLTAPSNRFTPEYNKEFGHPGYTGMAATWRSWQNNESTMSGYIDYPEPYDVLTSPARVNQPWINQYAYKLLWKWALPFEYGIGYIGQPKFCLYTEHTKLFDDIIQRSFGDRAWNRNGTMQWRVTPSGKGTGTASQAANPSGNTYTKTAENVTFVVEIMFDEPIFVSGRTLQKYDTAAALAEGSADNVLNDVEASLIMKQHIQNQMSFAGINNEVPDFIDIAPFSNLTLRGQSVIKYKRTDYNISTYVPT
jgi:hypothetical protein